MGDAGTRRTRGGSLGALLVIALALGVVFGLAPLVRYLRAPAISDGFGIEDAVVALRLEARDTSYLVLVNEAGETRSARLDERGFDRARLAWSEAGLSTGGPTHEYVLHEHGLTELSLPSPNGSNSAQRSSSEQQRLATERGFAVWNSSGEGQQLALVDAAAGRLTAVDAGYANPELAACDGELLMVRADGVEAVTGQTRDFDGLGMFDGVDRVACDAHRVYGLGEITGGSPALQTLRVWDRDTGAAGMAELRYPGSVIESTPNSFFAREGRLFWAADGKLWSARPPAATAELAPSTADPLEDELPVVETEPAASLIELVGGVYHPVVGTDEDALAQANGRVYGVAADEELVTRRRGPSHDRLDGFAVFSIDTATGESRVEIEVDDIDFPNRDLRVRAVAVDPAWAAAR